MCDLDNLKLESAMDKSLKLTKMAEEYINEHNGFQPINIDTSVNKDTDPERFKNIECLTSVIEKREALKKLAQVIKSKSDLICALEFHIRKQQQNDVETYLNLIINQFYSQETFYKYTLTGYTERKKVYLSSDKPLLVLGYIHDMIAKWGKFVLIVTPEMAPIGTLIAEMAREAGLGQNMGLDIVDTISQNVWHKDLLDFLGGCTCVVTSRCDLDSAVDKLVASSPNAPWRIQRVLVQESVYEYFKNAMKWKWELKNENEIKMDSPDLTYIIEGKLFTFDCTQRDVTGVIIEAYRTTKELLKLLSDYEPYHLSLWSNDLVEAHEIVDICQSSNIWINDHANFPTTYPIFNLMLSTLLIYRIIEYDELKEWLKLSFYERKAAILDSLDLFMDQVGKKDEVLPFIRSRIFDEQPNVVIRGTNSCLEIKKTSKYPRCKLQFPIFSSKCVFAALYGHGVMVFKLDNILSDCFHRNGVPIVDFMKSNYTADTFIKYQFVWSNFGTIFAN